MFSDPIKWILLGLLAFVSVIAGTQMMAKQAEQAAHARTKQQHAEVLRDLAERTAKVAIAAQAAQQALITSVAAIDQKHTKELSNAKRENSRLRTGLHDGLYRLRFNATCPAPGGSGVPETSTPSSLDDAAAPRPTPDAKQAYIDHRDAIEEVKRMVLGLQDYAKAGQGASQ